MATSERSESSPGEDPSGTLSHPLRSRILDLLEHRRQMTIGELSSELGASRAELSYHVGVLKRTGRVDVEAAGGLVRLLREREGPAPGLGSK